MSAKSAIESLVTEIKSVPRGYTIMDSRQYFAPQNETTPPATSCEGQGSVLDESPSLSLTALEQAARQEEGSKPPAPVCFTCDF